MVSEPPVNFPVMMSGPAVARYFLSERGFAAGKLKNWPQMNADKRRLKTNWLSASIGVDPRLAAEAC